MAENSTAGNGEPLFSEDRFEAAKERLRQVGMDTDSIYGRIVDSIPDDLTLVPIVDGENAMNAAGQFEVSNPGMELSYIVARIIDDCIREKRLDGVIYPELGNDITTFIGYIFNAHVRP
jgi:hypothetical protein